MRITLGHDLEFDGNNIPRPFSLRDFTMPCELDCKPSTNPLTVALRTKRALQRIYNNGGRSLYGGSHRSDNYIGGQYIHKRDLEKIK